MKRTIFTSLPVIALLLLPVSGQASYTFEDANYVGHEIEIIPDMRDPQECANRCEQNPNCLVASFHSPFAPAGWAYKCVLRSAVGERHLDQRGIMSWLKPHAPRHLSYLFESANYWTPELEIISNLRDPQECASRCDRNPNCKVASFHGPHAPEGWANKCVLRSTTEDRHTDQADIWSWVKP